LEKARQRASAVAIDLAHLQAVLAEVMKESDRGAVILLFGYIDDTLAALFRRMLNGEIKGGVDSLLQPTAMLGAAHNRLLLAASLWWIDKGTFAEISIIRSIRNAFAHKVGTSRFEHEPVRGLVASLPNIENDLRALFERHGGAWRELSVREQALMRMFKTLADVICEVSAMPYNRRLGVSDADFFDNHDELPANLRGVRELVVSASMCVLGVIDHIPDPTP